MVEFKPSEYKSNYFGPLEDDPEIEGPIIPLHELGTTILETDPRTGAHIIQNIEYGFFAAVCRGSYSSRKFLIDFPSAIFTANYSHLRKVLCVR